MKISVIGCGYLGAVHASAMATLGHDVIGIDVDACKVESLAGGEPPFFEPQLHEILAEAIGSGQLRFSTDIADAAGAQMHFIAVGTPQIDGGHAADLRYVNAAIDALLPHLQSGDLVVGKSTVPVGTAEVLAERIESSGLGATLAWNPEFLREGFAVKDTIAPDRLVYGVPVGEAGERAAAMLNEVYTVAIAAGTPVVVTDYATSELVKVAANAFLATKISFINAMSEIAEVTGADVTQLADAIGYDARIGRRFLNAGVGFGGGCLPKDIRAFQARAEQLGRGESVAFLKEVDAINLRRRQRVIDLALEALDGELVGKKIAVLGLAFKPHSDDVRDSPALDVAVQLFGRGVQITATDPQAIENARILQPQLKYSTDIAETLSGADALVLITEWPEFTSIDPAWAASFVSTRTIIDARNCLDAAAWRSADWQYKSLGRP